MSNNYKLAYFLAMWSLAVVARADNPFETAKQFSATVVMSPMPAMSGHGGQAGQAGMKMYRTSSYIRTDLPGGLGYMVIDLGQHTSYMVMGNGMCMQMTAGKQQNPFAQAHDATIDRSPVGNETVDGHACKVEDVTVTPHDGQPVKMKMWEAKDLKDFPIKIEIQSKNGPMTFEYKDISFSDPDPSLFAHPDNCRQMPTMPGSGPH